MQFIRLPKVIDIAERLLPELVADWMNTKSVQNFYISSILKLQVTMSISWVVKWSKSWIPHRHTFRNFTHWAWSIWDLSNHDLLWIIPNPGSQKRIILSLESISTIPFQARASDFKIPEWGRHCSNRAMPCLVSILEPFRGPGITPRKIQARFVGEPDIFSNNTDLEIQWPGMLVTRKTDPEGHVGCTNHWHNCRSSGMLILRIPPPITCVHLAVYLVTFRVCKAKQFQIEVHLKWEMCQKEL